MGLGVTKDTLFARWFGQAMTSGKPPAPFPMTSWGLFVTRDVMTIGAGFVFPGTLATGGVATTCGV